MPSRRDSDGKACGLSIQVREAVFHTATHRTAATGLSRLSSGSDLRPVSVTWSSIENARLLSDKGRSSTLPVSLVLRPERSNANRAGFWPHSIVCSALADQPKPDIALVTSTTHINGRNRTSDHLFFGVGSCGSTGSRAAHTGGPGAGNGFPPLAPARNSYGEVRQRLDTVLVQGRDRSRRQPDANVVTDLRNRQARVP